MTASIATAATTTSPALPFDSILHGDCLALLRTLPDASVDAIVTDPPYGLGTPPDMLDVLRAWLAGEAYIPHGAGFMGKPWDAFVPGPEYWRECVRVLKPGGHVLVFAGTRTWDVMGLALRLAGLEIRDTLQWLYGSGFPKSLDVGKAIDKAAGAKRRILSERKLQGKARVLKGGNYNGAYDRDETDMYAITAPATDTARQWDGWGTGLKPAYEPVIVCQKPYGIMGYCAIIDRSLLELQEALCKSSANGAGSPSLPTLVESSAVKTASARGRARTPRAAAKAKRTPTGAAVATNLAADTSASMSEPVAIALSTISSWRRILDGACALENRCTTETETSLITDLKTWSLLLSQITPESMLQYVSSPDGLSGIVSSAVNLSNAVSAKISSIHALFAVGSVIEQGRIVRQDEAAQATSSAWEPIILCRKPLSEPNVAANVLRYGTGALHVDACRIGFADAADEHESKHKNRHGDFGSAPRNPDGHGIYGVDKREQINYTAAGRWPANVTLDEDAAALLDAQSGMRPGMQRRLLRLGATTGTSIGYGAHATAHQQDAVAGYDDTGGASRFFYVAKASRAERNRGCENLQQATTFGPMAGRGQPGLKCRTCGKWKVSGNPCVCDEPDWEQSAFERPTTGNGHPTVKPLALMHWLITLITPPGGIVLDPFAGSGSTCVAAKAGGWHYIGMEREAEYVAIAEARLAATTTSVTAAPAIAKPKRAQRPKRTSKQTPIAPSQPMMLTLWPESEGVA